ncbi:MAG: RDD family protein [Bacteroidota bacterium]|nr:RDD family protein [Bacteroidota bacterium]MDP4218240.1 RDD family protein [Bacteroidota bacterium]MDP4246380.1 RDD family protein [Bacteroidota bacterium]MDP4254346.1 RDD family protein [Bacteroidota bacterium]MDP4259473.1 RDD family protein [Bacteroidota bacterium]
MLVVKLDTGFNIEVDFAITPFHKRFFAWCIDLAVVYSYVQFGILLLNAIFGNEWIQVRWAEVLFFLPPLLYHLLCEVFFNGQSLGKKAMHIKVISADGGHPSLSQYLIRWVFRLADFPTWIPAAIAFRELPYWCAVLVFSGLACVLMTRHSQRIGDLVAGTMLINTRNRTSWEDTVFTELEDSYQARFPQVMQLSDKDINTLKSIIETVRRKSDYDLSMRIGDRIKSKLNIVSDQDSLEFLETLLKDYNYYSTR